MTKKPRKPAALVEAKQITILEVLFRIVNDADSTGRTASEVKHVYEHTQKKTINTHAAHLKSLVDKGFITRKWYPPSETDKMGYYRYWSTEAGRNKYGVASAADVKAANLKGAREFAEKLDQLGKAVLLQMERCGQKSAIGLQKEIRIGEATPSLNAIEIQLTALAAAGMLEGTDHQVRSAGGSTHEVMEITEDGELVCKALRDMQDEELKPSTVCNLLKWAETKDHVRTILNRPQMSALCCIDTKTSKHFTRVHFSQAEARKAIPDVFVDQSDASMRNSISELEQFGLVSHFDVGSTPIPIFKLTAEGARIKNLITGVKPEPEYEVIPTMDAKRLYFAVRNDGAMKAVSGDKEIEFSPDDTKILYNLLSAIHGAKQ